MSLLEGYSNHVMNAAGERLLPGFRMLHDRFERRNERRGAMEQAIMRVTGLDLKMEQYAAGERFVDAVLAASRSSLPPADLGRSRGASRAWTRFGTRRCWIRRMEDGTDSLRGDRVTSQA